jgi:hypothetical protein
MSQSLILIDVLSSDFWKKKKKREAARILFFPGLDMPSWQAIKD